jgi:Tfp pilus assembly protein PilO
MRGEEVFLFVLAIVGCTLLAYPLVRALAERIRPRGIESGVKEELQILREDLLAELQQSRREIAEMGERMDFAERLLAKRIER